MEESIFEFVDWVYQYYGRLGCAVALLIIVGVLALVFYLLNRLPERKSEKTKEADQMENKKYSCYVMAEAIQAIMTMANFFGCINQPNGDRQFTVLEIGGDEEKSLLRSTFAGQSYKTEITLDDPQ